MVGSIFYSLDIVPDDLDITLGPDNLVSKCQVVGVSAELPGPVVDVLDLLLQSLLKADEELGILSLEPSPLNVLWLPREMWIRREILREILSRDHCAQIWLLISQDYLSSLVQGLLHCIGSLFILGLIPAGTVGSLTAGSPPFGLTGFSWFCCLLPGHDFLGSLPLHSLIALFLLLGTAGR